MSLVIFLKDHEYHGHLFKVDEVYDFPREGGLYLKFVTYSGTAVPFEGEPENGVQETPDLSGFRSKLVAVKVETSDSPYRKLNREVTTEETETKEETSLDEGATEAYTLEHHGGPWYNVVDSLGVKVNEKPLTKTHAQELVDELGNEAPESSAD